MVGLEPTSREAVDFESTEFTISPHRHSVFKKSVIIVIRYLKVNNI